MRWLGLGATREDSPAGGDHADHASAADPQYPHRKRALDDISGFLLFHRLPVTPLTLRAAYEVITGTNPVLSQEVEGRVSDGAPITMPWLQNAMQELGREGGTKPINALAVRLETMMGELGQTASDARTATTDYNSALAAHVDELGASGHTVIELAGLARDMLAMSRDVEHELGRAEDEIRRLQQSLADARREAEVDHLTGLPNRRAFEAVFKRECEQAAEAGEALCVAFCDVDEFKRINDVHGHDAGDRVLRTVAQSLALISSDTCHVARHGGEEFVVLLRGSGIEEAWETLDHARRAMADRRLVNRNTDVPFGTVTFSAGVADVFAYPDSRDALRAADEALYRAKAEGRNRVIRATA